MNENLSSTEHPEKSGHKPKSEGRSVDFNGTHQKVLQLKDNEHVERLKEVCTTVYSSILGFSSSEVFDALTSNSLFQKNPEEILNTPISSIQKFVNQYHELRHAEDDERVSLQLVNEAHSLSNKVDELKKSGFSNTEIVRQILKENETGQLTLPHEKLILYKKFLDLSASQEYGQDSQAINSIIDHTPIDFNDPGSFETVLQNIYISDLVSENTKVKIEQQFGIPPIRNGLELRRAVTFREKLHAQYMKAMGAIDSDIEEIGQNIEDLTKALQEIHVRIEESPTFEEQFELEDKRDELKRELDRLENNRLQLQSDKENLEEKLPLEEAVLLNGRLTIEDGIFSLKMADGNIFSLPEGLSNNELADMANSYFIWQKMNSLGLAHTLFPEEDLSEGKLPSGRFINFVSRFLGTFNLSHSGSILSLEELYDAQGVINRLRSPETLDNKLLTNEEGARKDLELLGIIHSEKVNYDRLEEMLVKISISDKSVSAFDLAA